MPCQAPKKGRFHLIHLSQERPIPFCALVLMIDRSFCVMRAERVYTLLVLGSCGLLHGFYQILRSYENFTASADGKKILMTYSLRSGGIILSQHLLRQTPEYR